MSFDTANTENFAHLVARWQAIDNAPALDRAIAAEWLEDALHAAIKLEFSTIPPYLCALWSVKDQSDPIALSIRSVVQEEMLHMALACNMLVAIGGTPKIADPAFAPIYPGKLAGGVHDSLVVRLTHLSDSVLEDFLLIERPERDMANETDALKDAVHLPGVDEDDSTIGEFYDLLVKAFDRVQPEFETERQISGPLAWFPVRNLDEVRKAVDLIKHQGEGSTSEPNEADDGELAHFYRFLEILKRRRIEKKPDGRWGFGADIPAVDVYPMAEVPPRGFDENQMPARVRQLIDDFDAQYTKLLKQLGDLWARGDQGQLIQAIETMFSLQGPARELMQIEIAGQSGETYGPCFRVKDKGKSPMTDPQAEPIKTRFLFRIVIETNFKDGRIKIVKDTPWGKLVNVAVVGGTVSGPAITGRVLNMGGDWGVQHKIKTPEGVLAVTELDCKLMIETDDTDPALIEMSYGGISYETVDKKSYLRTTPRFRTADPRYEALNRTVAVASGFHRDEAGPIYDVYEVL